MPRRHGLPVPSSAVGSIGKLLEKIYLLYDKSINNFIIFINYIEILCAENWRKPLLWRRPASGALRLFFDAPLDLVARSGLPDSSTRHQPGSPCSMFSTRARVFTQVRAVRAGTTAPTLPWLSNLHWLFDMAGLCRATPCEVHRDR